MIVGYLAFSAEFRVRFLLMRGERNRARAMLEYLVERNPERFSLYNKLAEIYYKENRKDRKAIRMYETIVRLKLPCEFRDELYPIVAKYYINEGRQDSDAIRLIEKAVEKEMSREVVG
jgi:tetratricopeptide (TPR) repeat protein